MAALEIKSLGVTLDGKPALSDVSLSIGAGERVGLIGESGAGKTALLLAIVGLLPEGTVAGGSTSFGGQPLTPETPGIRGKRIGVLFQDAADEFDPLEPALALLNEALVAAGEADAGKAADELLAQVGLSPARAAFYPGQLSAGERQLLAVAAALAGKPELLIADEPSTHLDLVAERRVLDLIGRLCTERGMALLLASRELRAVAMLCTRIVVLQRGKVVEAGDKADVFGRPKHDYTRTVLTAGRYRARALMRTPIGDTLLDVRGVTKTYRRPGASLFERQPHVVALDAISLAVRIGESVALVGPAGAGKTTLGRIIAGLERTSKGALEFDARVYHGPDLVPVNRPDITMVFRDPQLSFDPQLSVGESIAEPLALFEEPVDEDLNARIAEVVAAVGFSAAVLDRYPGRFSPGELQRLAIARALVSRPKLVVLDEPISALDIGSRGEILALLDRLRADFGLTLLVTGRDLDTVRVIADRVLVMDAGRIVESGTPAQLLEKPQHEITKRLVAAALPEIGIVPVF